MDKQTAYNRLVAKRKECMRCNGLCNPSTVLEGAFDTNQLGPWSAWQHNLDAEVLVVGQDWGDVKYFEKWKGRDQPKGNPTNENLRILLTELDIDIGRPEENLEHSIFLTNLILCLKGDGLQGGVDNSWFSNCSLSFFKELVDVIKPKVIIALGKKTCESIFSAYNVSHNKNKSLETHMESSPYLLQDGIHLFPVYHCGARSINCNRSFDEQKKDWKRIKSWRDENTEEKSEYIKIALKQQLLDKFSLPQIQYPIPIPYLHEFLPKTDEIEFPYLLHWLLQYSAETKKWVSLEEAILRLSEIIIADDGQDVGTIHTDDFTLKISSYTFPTEAISIIRESKLLATITPTQGYKLNVTVYHALDARTIDTLVNLSINPHPVHGVCMRENNWKYALDMAAPTLGSMYAMERGDSYLSYWENGLGVTNNGDIDPLIEPYLKTEPLKPHIIAAQVGVYYELHK